MVYGMASRRFCEVEVLIVGARGWFFDRREHNTADAVLNTCEILFSCVWGGIQMTFFYPRMPT